jgi:peptidoglycan/xylan/chitin deacetylase (PgdA/CDA1 family)
MIRSKSPTIVLLYHRVARVERDPQMLCVSPKNFAEQLGVMQELAEIVPLKSVLSPSNGARVAITFDDGYADNYDNALPQLRRAEAHATVFVVSGAVGARREFWWDRLENLLLSGVGQAKTLEVSIAGRQIWCDARGRAGRYRTYWALHTRLKPIPPAEIDRVLDSIATQLGVFPPARETHLAVDVSQLVELARSGHVDIGAHTVRHPWLPALSREEQLDEVEGGRSRLEELLKVPVDTFAYPYGEPARLHGNATRAVRSYRLVCANIPGTVRRRDRFRIPRYIVRDWDGEEFRRRLHGWLS